MSNKEKRIRFCGFAACEIFALTTIVLLIINKQHRYLPLAIGTPFMIMVPRIIEKLSNCKFSLPIYLYTLFYSIGPALGECHNLYHTVSWWDKFLHVSGGVLFALFGFLLFEKFIKTEKKPILMIALFGFCFSIVLSVLWEFFEFGADILFGTDMQKDVVINNINSYLFSDNIGAVGSINNIEDVVVNGERLPVNGYIDIGLIDTMLDMLIEAMGAFAISVIYILSRGKIKVFTIRT